MFKLPAAYCPVAKQPFAYSVTGQIVFAFLTALSQSDFTTTYGRLAFSLQIARDAQNGKNRIPTDQSNAGLSILQLAGSCRCKWLYQTASVGGGCG